MENIKKVFSLILIMTFLCQNAAFCATGRSFTLRAPSHFSKSTEEFVENQHERKDHTTPLLATGIEKLIRVSFAGNIIIVNAVAEGQRYEISGLGVKKIKNDGTSEIVEDPRERRRIADLVNRADRLLGEAAIEEKWDWWTPQSDHGSSDDKANIGNPRESGIVLPNKDLQTGL